MNQNKDLKAIAEEVIEEAKRKEAEAQKPIHDLYEQLKFFNSTMSCRVQERDHLIELSFRGISWYVFVTDTPNKYSVIYPIDNNAKTECYSLEQLVRFIANFSVTKDFDTAAKLAGCEYVEREDD